MKKTISTLNFMNVLITAVLFTGVIGYYFFYAAERDFEHQAERMRVRFTNAQKMLIREEINRIVKRIEHLRESNRRDLHNIIQEKIETAGNIVAQRSKLGPFDIETCLSTITLNDMSSNFFTFRENGEITYFGSDKSLIGQNIFTSPQIDKHISEYAKLALTGERVQKEYSVSGPIENESETILVHIGHIQQPNIFIGLKSSFSNIDRRIRAAMLASLENERHGFNNFGYFIILNPNKTILMHPYLSENNRNNDTKIYNDEGIDILGLIHDHFTKSDNGYIEYTWQFPDNSGTDKKTLYYSYYPDWNWIICTGFYFNDLEEFIEMQRADIRESIQRKTTNLLLILAALFLFTTTIAFYVSQRLRRIEKEQALHLNELEQYKMILDESSVVSRTTESGEITYINEGFSRLSGFSHEEAIGQQHNIIRHPDTPKRLFKDLWDTILSGNIWKGVIKNRAKSGDSYYFSATIAPLRNEAGEIKEFIASGADVTELLENRKKLDQMFITDSLTGLGNRFRLLSALEKNDQAALALIDIDRFGEYNDLNGQDAGDSILKELAEQLFLFCDKKTNYQLYRLQADVFAVMAITEPIDTFTSFINDILQMLTSTRFGVEDQASYFNFTIGVADGGIDLLAFADIAMQRAKALRRDMIVYDPKDTQITESFQENINWLTHLKNGLDNNRIVPYFQPIVDYKTGKVTKYECLMRLIDEEGKPIPPGAYLSIAKKTKIYPALTYRIIDKAIAVFNDLPYEFSVNLTIEDFLNDDTMNFIFSAVKQSGIMNRMTIEVVESEEMVQYERIADLIERLRNVGVKIAIDDFGSGYSNYDYLLELKADYIKIDGSIVRRLPHDPRTRALVRSIVEFARKSGIQTIAEFIADEEVFQITQSLGIDYGQGYYIGKPASKPETDIDFSEKLSDFIR